MAENTEKGVKTGMKNETEGNGGKRYRLRCTCIVSLSLLLLTACDTGEPPQSYSDKREEASVQSPAEIEESIPAKVPDSDMQGAEEVDAIVLPLTIPDGQSIASRFDVPEGYVRVESEEGSFAEYLRNLPLKPHGTKVSYYDGREKLRDVYLAVADFSLGNRDLQQCADAVIRLRAEYLYAGERFEEIHFNFVSGFNAEFSKWAEGNGISVNGNSVSWNADSSNNGSYESFQKYLDMVYAYASTLSLEKELKEKPVAELAIGDVFIKGGSPGHCVIVVDMAVNAETGKKLFMLAQSYMPAQDIQILRGEEEESPWYDADIEELLKTPEWTFQVSELRTWQ